MKLSKDVLILMMVGSLVFTGFAAGGKEGGGGSGESGTTAVIILFRDAVGDRIGSDCFDSGGGCSYEHGVNAVEAFIGSKANYGNIWLRTRSNRALYVNFSDCASPPKDSPDCAPPFESTYQSPAAIKVDADNVIQDGIYGMSVGDINHVPMRVYLDDPVKWFIDFNPDLNAMKQCKNSTKVKVERIAQDTWEISGGVIDDLGCLSENIGTKSEHLGNYHMPFSMRVKIK